jgi:CheY-like chemotaxis protein
VRTAYDGPDALKLAANFKPEVVILDLGLPTMDGFEIARQIESQPWGADIALVALTGWGQQQDYRRTTDAGFDAHLVKPVAPEELLKVLAHVSSHRGPSAQAERPSATSQAT